MVVGVVGEFGVAYGRFNWWLVRCRLPHDYERVY